MHVLLEFTDGTNVTYEALDLYVGETWLVVYLTRDSTLHHPLSRVTRIVKNHKFDERVIEEEQPEPLPYSLGGT